MLQTQAFRERLEWARLDPDKIADRGYPSDARARALTAQLRREALDLRIANPNELPAWADDWWGELHETGLRSPSAPLDSCWPLRRSSR